MIVWSPGAGMLPGVVAAIALNLSNGVSAQTTQLEPQGNWTLDFADEKCRLTRLFGENDEATLFYLEQFAPSDQASMAIAGNPIGPLSRGDEIKVRFGPRDEHYYDLPLTEAKFGNIGDGIMLRFLPLSDLQERDKNDKEKGGSHFDTIGVPRIDPDEIKGVEWLSLLRRGREVVLPLPGFQQAIAALNTCSLDLVRHWNLDTQEHKTMSRLVEPLNLSEVAEKITKEYFGGALRNGEQANLNLRIIVNENGSIDECSVSNVTTVKYLKTNACDIFGRRAMFTPARNAAGEPMKSFYDVELVYRVSGF